MKPTLPQGRFRRALELAKVGARAGASLATKKGTEVAAERAAEVLGNLRGLAAKVGQTLSYVDGVLPEGPGAAAFEKTLRTLQKATLASSPETIRARVESELGASIEASFAEFDAEPFASASIGQVHRARLRDGRDVAVKVQHPGIDEAVRADLQNISLLEGVIGIAGPRGLETGPLVDEIVRRFQEELDYEHEARAQKAFRDFFAGDARVVIPEVIEALSTKRVLVSTWETGSSLDDVATSSEELRRVYAETLWRFVFRGNLVGGSFNADPHPGNYSFRPDGSVVFFDFGCIQPIPERARRAALRVHEAAAHGEEAAFRVAVGDLLGTRGGSYAEATARYVRLCFEPLFQRPFHLTRAYAASLVAGARELKKAMYAKDGSFVSPPSHLGMMNRLQFGFYSVLARLDVSVDYAALEDALVEEGRTFEAGAISSRL